MSRLGSNPLGFLLHFLFGGLFGAIMGFGLGALLMPSQHGIFMLPLVAALVFGLAAGHWGDDFWDYLKNTYWWRLPFLH